MRHGLTVHVSLSFCAGCLKRTITAILEGEVQIFLCPGLNLASQKDQMVGLKE